MSSQKIFDIAFKLGAKLDPSVKKNFSAAGQQLSNMKKNIGGAVKTAAKLSVGIAAAGTAAAGAAVMMANKFAATGDRIDKLSQKIGLSREGFQEWEFILSQSGTDIEKMQTGLKTLNQRMDESTKGTGKGAEAFKALKLSATDSSGALKTQEQMFEETVKKLQEMPEGSKKAQLAFELFGKAGQELMPLLNGAAGSVDEMKKKAHDLGIVIGDEGVDSAILWTDTMDQANRALGGLFNVVAGSAMPVMQKFLDYGISKLPVLREKVTNAMTIAGNVIGWVGEKGTSVFRRVQVAIQDNMPTIQALQATAIDLGGHIKGIFQTAKPYISWFFQNGIPAAVNVLAGLLDGAVNTYNFITNNWSWIAPIVGGITAALITYRAVTQSIILVKGALAAAQIAWNIAMTANPIGLIIVGIGALIGIGYLLIKNYKEVGAFFVGLWTSFIGWVSPVGPAISNTFTGAYNAITGLFSGIGGWFGSILNGVVGIFKGKVNGIISIANAAISGLNNVNVSIPDWVPGLGGKTFGVNIPKIPMLAQGGITTGATLAMIGEGAEQEAVLPLSKLQALLDDPSGDKGTTNNNNGTDNDFTFVYSPNITVEGNADQETIRQALGMNYAEFKRFMDRYNKERNRLSFNN
ncbi:phage tail tape measure protein [Bacillus solitudinis]|uniref:hypothetical protein n=1 Tax=Bacillus solitudinis TaxID=2014074 RepID=UPI000C250943|nr:hypothetical protein [Bacillus solitudinis]